MSEMQALLSCSQAVSGMPLGDGMAATVVGRRRRHACRRRGFTESGKGRCARVEAEQSDGEKHVLFGPLRKWADTGELQRDCQIRRWCSWPSLSRVFQAFPFVLDRVSNVRYQDSGGCANAAAARGKPLSVRGNTNQGNR